MIIENVNPSQVNDINNILDDMGKGIYTYKASDTPITTNNSIVTVPVVAIQGDNPLGLTVTTDGIKIKKTGWYSIYAQIFFNNTNANNILTLFLRSDNRILASVTKMPLVNGNDYYSLSRAFCYLNADEIVKLNVYGLSNVTAKGGEYNSFIDLRLIKYS